VSAISRGGNYGESAGSIRPVGAHSSHNTCSNFQASIPRGNAAGMPLFAAHERTDDPELGKEERYLPAVRPSLPQERIFNPPEWT